MKKLILGELGRHFRLRPIYFIKEIVNKLNFEFMDLNFLPDSLRFVLRDILEVGSSFPFRSYYQWVASSVYEYAIVNNIKEIVELGAGGAPITKCLIKKYPHWKVTFKISDIAPDRSRFECLENLDKRVVAIYEPLDFTQKISGYENSLLILSAAFHHVSEKNKRRTLNSLKSLSPQVIIFEPVRREFSSFILNLGILFTGIMTPFLHLNSKVFLRSLLWCWLLPIAPLLLLWDGTISALRCWKKKQWHEQEPEAIVCETCFCSRVILKNKR